MTSATDRVDDVRRALRRHLALTYGEGEGEAMTRLIFSALKDWSVTDLLIHADDRLSDFMLSEIDRILSRIDTGEPIQYVLGKARFYGMDFTVTPAVLIPRPETEELIDIIVKEYGDRKDLRVLDLGTGSGCIAIALARHLPFSQVTAVDISAEALTVARENAGTLKANVDFIKGDMLIPDKPVWPEGKFDIIVSNPPYICEKEKIEMERNVLDYEPARALFVPDDDPLKFYRAIADIGVDSLAPDGALFLEINPLYYTQLTDMLRNKGYEDVQVIDDISRRKRFIQAKSPAFNRK